MVAAVIRVQLLTGARPGEIRVMRPCDISLGTGDTWSYRPHRYKTQHRGKDRIIFIGPGAQDVLRPFLAVEGESCCFSPAKSESLRSLKRRKLADVYTKDSYARAVKRACKAAGVVRNKVLWTG
jgi:integrase